MEDKRKIKFPEIAIDADLSDASLILGEPIGKSSNIRELNVNIAEGTKQHDVMGYTTDLNTMRLIFQNKTIRSSSLSNVNLNDAMEKQRVGVSEFASSRFIV